MIVDGKEVLLPGGTETIVAFWAMHRDPGLWKRAGEFRPERWIEEEEEGAEGPIKCRRDAWFPFSAESRDCIGKVGWRATRAATG